MAVTSNNFYDPALRTATNHSNTGGAGSGPQRFYSNRRVEGQNQS